jgi:serine/threonine-protein kinase
MQPYQPTTGEQVAGVVGLILMLSMLVGGVLLARRNLRLGRGDRRGAGHIAGFVFAVWAVAWSFGAHHVSNVDEFGQVFMFVIFGISFSAFFWVVYIALEPYVRRRWPDTLVSWSRLLAGGFRDPLVGRDVLFGCLLGPFAIASVRLGWHIPSWPGHPPLQPYSGPQWQFLGARTVIADLSNSLILSLFISFVILFTLFLLRALLRKEWVAAIVCILLITFFRPPSADPFTAVTVVSVLITTGLTVFLFLRFGLLAVVASYFFTDILGSFPLTTQGSAWYAGLSLAGILLMVAMAFYGFYTSLGGRPIFGGAVLEE